MARLVVLNLIHLGNTAPGRSDARSESGGLKAYPGDLLLKLHFTFACNLRRSDTLLLVDETNEIEACNIPPLDANYPSFY